MLSLKFNDSVIEHCPNLYILESVTKPKKKLTPSLN